MAPNSENQSFVQELPWIETFHSVLSEYIYVLFQEKWNSHLQKKVNLYPKHFNKKLKQTFLSCCLFFFCLGSQFEHMTFVAWGKAKVSPYLWGEIRTMDVRDIKFATRKKKRLSQFTHSTRNNEFSIVWEPWNMQWSQDWWSSLWQDRHGKLLNSHINMLASKAWIQFSCISFYTELEIPSWILHLAKLVINLCLCIY